MLGGIYGALAVKGLSASALASQQFVVCGAGSAGMGVVSFLAKAMSKHGITEEEARQRFWILDVDGLITSGRDGHVPDFVRPFARMDAELEGADLLSVIQHAKPTVLIGASTVGGLFTSDHLGEMTKHCDRPLVMALSNPTSKLECTSEQCAAWTKGRGIYAAGSPQPDCVYDGKEVASSQANNMYIFPGLALGASVGKAKVITDAMLMKASESLVDCITAEELERGSIYPKLGSIREISLEIACSVIEQAVRDGVTKAESRAVEVLAEQGREGLRGFVRSRMFQVSESRYHPVAKKKKLTRAPILLQTRKPFLNDPSALQSTASDPALLAAALPALYASVVTDNPRMYNWLVTLPNQCIVDQGYIQPVAVILTEGTMFETIGENLPKLVDEYYNTGCTTAQFLAFVPVFLEAFNLPTAEQTNAIFQKFGTTPSGEQVRFTQPFNGGPSILQCVTPSESRLVSRFPTCHPGSDTTPFSCRPRHSDQRVRHRLGRQERTRASVRAREIEAGSDVDLIVTFA